MNSALTGVAQWAGCHHRNQKEAGLIPGQGTCLGCGPGLWFRVCERQPINVSLCLSPSLPPLSKRKIMNSFSLMDIGLFMLSILCWLNFVVCGFQGTGPFLLRCQVSEYEVAYSTLITFKARRICSNTHHFNPDTGNPSSFFSPAKDLLILLTFFKEPAFCLIDLIFLYF